jgi:predicted dehydrogenase
MPDYSTVRWGIIGPGRIAGVFAEGLRELTDAQLVAVGSRSQANADQFGDKYGVAGVAPPSPPTLR